MWPGLVGAVLSLVAAGPPVLDREFRGAWVATVDNIDWPSKPGLDPGVQRDELQKLLKRLSNLRFNAVVFQVRPSADAVYKSSLEPSSWFVTGEQGKAIEFDPLAFVVEEGHRLGLEVHAWFNPFRAVHPAQKGPCAAQHVSVGNADWVRQYGVYSWMDPGVPEAREHTYSVFMDVLARYDIDGVHIDDYFYPYPAGGAAFQDENTHSKYGQGLSIGDWRRRNVDEFIERLYKGIKAQKPWVKFGISPFGIYRPGVPEGIQASIDQYDDLAADVLKWLQSGWCDYLSPQLYWKIDSKGQPFGRLLEWWQSSNAKNRHVWPGLYTSLIKKTWTPGELLNQIRLTRKEVGAPGQVHFSANALVGDYKGLSSALATKVYARPAAVPAVPWLGRAAPTKPRLVARKGKVVQWGASTMTRFFAVWELTGGKWQYRRTSSRTDYKASAKAQAVAVTPYSRTGAVGPSLTVTLEGS